MFVFQFEVCFIHLSSLPETRVGSSCLVEFESLFGLVTFPEGGFVNSVF